MCTYVSQYFIDFNTLDKLYFISSFKIVMGIEKPNWNWALWYAHMYFEA